MTPTFSDAAWAVLYHLYHGEQLDPDTLALYASFDPPLPYRRGDFTEAECREALDGLIGDDFAHIWTEASVADEEARWVSEPLPVSVGVEREIEPDSVGLTRAGWEVCDERWGILRTFVLTSDDGPSHIRILADSEAACMTRRDQLVADINEHGWVDSELNQHAAHVADVSPVERIRGWWYNRFVCIRPGFSCVVTYRFE